MRVEDMDAVCALETKAYEFPWSRAIIGGCTTVSYRIWLGTVPGGSTHVCQGFLSVAAGEAHVLNVAVEPELQGKGYGSVLLNHLIKDATDLGAEQMFLEVRERNAAAIHMYLKRGFNEIGRRPGYYPAAQGREDALVFALHLGLE